MTSISGSK